ncbi:MAG TPA: hypothetical protein VKC90_01910 [Chitinophagaceae bacterium]|nr:hypothetical protein [Chitinophagaceae bacterium]
MRTYLKILFVAIVFIACSKSSTSYVNNPNAPDFSHNRLVGESANELLASAIYKSVKIEIQYMTGYAPDAAAVNNLQGMLSNVLNKPGGISAVTKEITASLNTTLTINEVSDIEKNNRTAFTTGDQIALYVLYTNGNYTDANVLGAAYKNTSVVIFGKNIYDNSGGIGQASRTKLESTVLEHELGHLLGLVDLGSTMQTNHKDAAHGNHCNNSSCLMYYASETKDILGFLITGNIPSFDANCLADLHANGGR